MKTMKNYADEPLKIRKTRGKNEYSILVTKNITGKTRVAHDNFDIDAVFSNKFDAQCYLAINALVLA